MNNKKLSKQPESPKFSKIIPFKSPFRKGGFRGISTVCRKIPPNPPLRKGGIVHLMISGTYENFRLSRKQYGWLKSVLIFFILCFAVFLESGSFAAEDPDTLYRKGRFAEAEKAYAQSDMDHPKDLRYRYNRGCAAYQGGNYQGAVGAFSSVMKRASDNETRHKAAFNAGNAAFKQGDYASAVGQYKQAIVFQPESTEAKYNLELALRALEKQKQQEQKQSETGKQREEKKKEGPSKSDQNKDARDKTSKDKNGEQGKQNKKKEQEPSRNAEKDKPKEKDDEEKRDREPEQKPEDLTGDLKAQAPPPVGGEKEDRADKEKMSSMDRQKAEALLGNIKEDRSRFLKYMLPRRKKESAFSGKDW